jgi:putative ABC transport system permease protein
MTPVEARAAAARRFGNRASAKEKFYESNRIVWLDLLQRDFRYAIRTLTRTPTFTCVAVLTIALGIGLNTGIFTVLNGIALKPLPAPNASQLLRIHQTIRETEVPRSAHQSINNVSTEEYRAYREMTRTLSGLAAFDPFVSAILGGETPIRVFGEMVSCNYFDVLALPPVLGTGFDDSDCQPGAPPAVILSHDFWSSRYAADPSVLGQVIVLNRENFRIVGIAPEEYRGAEYIEAAFWAPIEMQPILEPGDDLYTRSDMSWLALLGRRASGVGLDEVRAELDVIGKQLDRLETGRTSSVVASPATFFAFPDSRGSLLSMMSIVMVGFGLVLLIACANVTNLLLVRASARSKELAVRLSLGATRSRLVQQVLIESLLISVAGGALGSGLAALSSQNLVNVILPYLPLSRPITFDTAPDLRVVWYALGVTFLTATVFGCVPALQASRPDLNSGLKLDGAGFGRRPLGWLRSGLVAVQVSVSMVLLVAAGLLVLGLYATYTVDPGFTYEDVVVVSDLASAESGVANPETLQAQLVESIQTLPGFEQTAQAMATPLSQARLGTTVWLEGQDDFRFVSMNEVSPGYFDLLDIPIVRGHDFSPADVEDLPASMIVTESTANRFWPGEDPLTKTLGHGSPERRSLQVIGVARDAEVVSLGEDDTPFVYLPIPPERRSNSLILARTSTDFASASAAIRMRAEELDSGLLVEVDPLEKNLDTTRSISMLATTLAGSLGALALLLASIGVYGVVAYTSERRMHEVGIRLMLGASGREVIGMLLRQAMRPVLIGGAVGILVSGVASHVLSSVLFGVNPLHPVAFVVIPLCLMGVTALASVIPARHAVRTDPLVTLRHD